jgi:hypothetical protein
MKSARVFLLVFFLLYGFGCATTPIEHNYIVILNSWLGKNWEHLLRNWGIPDKSLTPNEGGMIIEYIDRPLATADGIKHPTPTLQTGQKPFRLSGELGKTGGSSIDYEKGTMADSGTVYLCKIRFFIERNGTVKKWQIMYE